MTNTILIAILAGLGGMLGWGLADFFAKKTIDKIGDTASLAWGHIFGTLALITAVIVSLTKGNLFVFPDNVSIWFGLIFFGVLQAIVYLYVYKGFGKGHVSLLSPVFASFSGITAILSILIFKEVVSLYLIIGLIVLFLGIILINTEAEKFHISKINFIQIPGFKEVGIATILAALWTLFWDKFIGGADWLYYTFYMYTIMTLTILLVVYVKKIPMAVKDTRLWKFLVLIGVTEVIAYVAISWGYSATLHTSVIALLSGAFSLPVLILARLFLNERLTKIQLIGSVVTIIGIMLVSII